jgi:shikimate dehydrogenase
MQYLDEISPEARKIGAVNTVVNRDGKLYGYNTDYYGFMYQVKESGAEIKGKDVVILGRGGAAKTVSCVCRDMGAESVRLLTRDDNPENFYNAEIIVNATPEINSGIPFTTLCISL